MKKFLENKLGWVAATSAAMICIAATRSGMAFGSKKGITENSTETSSSLSSSSNDDSVWVKRPDGGKQCAPNSAQDLDLGSKELAKIGVPVLESHKKNDGKMRVQVCGQPTGNDNAYRILKSALPKANALGFKALE